MLLRIKPYLKNGALVSTCTIILLLSETKFKYKPGGKVMRSNKGVR